MKAVLDFRAGTRLRSRLAALPDVHVTVVDDNDEHALVSELANAQVLLHVLRPVTATIMDHAPHLRLIQKIGVGVNTIDRQAAKDRGIRVANMPGINSQAVAEQALMLMLAVLRNVLVLHEATRGGAGWSVSPDVTEASGEIAGRTVGLIGFGAIPRLLAPVLHALGAKVLYYARTNEPYALARYVELETLISHSDIVSLHVPLSEETRGLISEARIARMKRGAILINTARGELVDEAALATALINGHLAGAGLDVFAREPVNPRNPLLNLSNVTLTPHVAWLTPETIERSLHVVMENIGRLRTGAPLLHEVSL